MSEQRRQEFETAVQAAIDAIREYREGRIRGDWFERGLEERVKQAVEALLEWGIERKAAGSLWGFPVVRVDWDDPILNAEVIDG